MPDAISNVQARLAQLDEQIGTLESERASLLTYLEVHAQYNRDESSTTISGKDIDTYCFKALTTSDQPLGTAALLQLLADSFNVKIEGSSPPRLISTRLSANPLFESTSEGWCLALRGDVREEYV